MSLEIALPENCYKTLLSTISNFIQNKKVIIGVSGGLDSAVTLKLLVDCLGKEKVIALHLPESTTPVEDSRDIELISKVFDVEIKKIPINDILKSYSQIIKEDDILALANLKARIRMNILYYYANIEQGLVIGTSNKTEIRIGYFTKYGDGASDFAPIGDLYKTQVRMLAKEIGIPENIINKPPSAGLWKDQTDEEEIGITYDLLDKILLGMELEYSSEKISDMLQISKDEVEKVGCMIKNCSHKCEQVVIPNL